MKLPRYRIGDPILPTEAEAAMALASSQILASYLENREDSCTIKLMEDENNGKTIEIPAHVMQLLVEILVHTGMEHPVKIKPYTKELADYQAADILGITRHQVWELMESGKIPYKIEDNIHVMHYEDVIAYKQQKHAGKMKAMDELVAESQALGMYD